MNQPGWGGALCATGIQEGLLTFTGKSERTVMLGTILLVSAVSVATGYFFTQCYSVDVISSLLLPPEDCWLDWGTKIGRHCFGDYGIVVGAGMRPNPWEPYGHLPPDYRPLLIPSTAAGMMPHLLFGLPAKWLGAPRLGQAGYQLALTIAVLSPAVWASRGTRGLERVVVFVALSAAAIPVWGVLDRAHSVGFVAPIALVFLVALCRRRWGLVTVMVVLATLVKPQFAVLAVALFVVRQWRWGALTLGGIALSNLAAYLLWPRDFPATIPQSIHNFFDLGTSFAGLTDLRNVSFSRALLLIPDMVNAAQPGGDTTSAFLAGPRWMIGLGVLVLVVVCVLALGRRIPPVMVGFVLLAAATFCPSEANYYHLIFVLPVAALVVRDPDGPPGTGIFDRLAIHDARRHAVGIWLSLAAALSIAQVALPVLQPGIPIYGPHGQIGTTTLVATTVTLVPWLWLIACAVIIVSYARRPAPSPDSNQEPAREGPADTAAVGTASGTSEVMTESSPHGPA